MKKLSLLGLSSVVFLFAAVSGAAEFHPFVFPLDAKDVGPGTVWNAKVETRPLIDGARVYFGTDAGYFYGVDRAEGKLAWKLRSERSEGSFQTSPAAGDGLVFTATSYGWIYAISETDGAIRWKTRLNDTVTRLEAALVYRDGVLVVGDSGTTAFDALTGKPLWKSKVGNSSGRPSPLALVHDETLGDEVLVPSDDGLVALSLHSGERLWSDASQLFTGRVETGIAIDRGTAYFGNMMGQLAAFELGSKSPVWTYRSSEDDFDAPFVGGTRPALDETRVFLPTFGRDVIAFDRADGRRLWTYHSYRLDLNTAVTAGEGLVFVGSYGKSGARMQNARLTALDAATGALVWRRDFEEGFMVSGVTLSDGLLYAGDWGSGSFYALDARTGSDGSDLPAPPAPEGPEEGALSYQGSIDALAVSPSGRFVAVVARGDLAMSRLTIWDRQTTPATAHRYRMPGALSVFVRADHALFFDGESHLFALTEQKREGQPSQLVPNVIDLATGNAANGSPFAVPSDELWVGWIPSREGTRIAILSSPLTEDKPQVDHVFVRSFDVSTSQQLGKTQKLDWNPYSSRVLALSDDGMRLAISLPKGVRLLDMEHGPGSLAPADPGASAVFGENGALVMENATTGGNLTVFSPEGKNLCGVENPWSWSAGQRARLEAFTEGGRELIFLRDSITTSHTTDRQGNVTLRAYDAKTCQALRETVVPYPGVWGEVQLSPAGRWLGTYDHEVVRVLDLTAK